MFKVKLPKFRVSRDVAENAVQLCGLALILIGVAAWSVPCALILGGLVVIAAIERQT
jgi:hypothetical protein